MTNNMMVYATKSREFKHSGTKHGKPRFIFRSWPVFTSWIFRMVLFSFIAIDITKLRRANIGDAYVITNIITPLSTVE